MLNLCIRRTLKRMQPNQIKSHFQSHDEEETVRLTLPQEATERTKQGKTRNKRKTKFRISDWARLETTYAPIGELRDIRKTQNEGFGILEPMILIQEILLRKPVLKYLKL